MNDIQCELENERELKEAMREMKRSENLIKYKDEISSRPKKEWFQGKHRREEAANEARQELQTIKNKFEGQLQSEKKRDKKKKSKSKSKGTVSKAPQLKERPKIFKKKAQLKRQKKQ